MKYTTVLKSYGRSARLGPSNVIGTWVEAAVRIRIHVYNVNSRTDSCVNCTKSGFINTHTLDIVHTIYTRIDRSNWLIFFYGQLSQNANRLTRVNAAIIQHETKRLRLQQKQHRNWSPWPIFYPAVDSAGYYIISLSLNMKMKMMTGWWRYK